MSTTWFAPWSTTRSSDPWRALDALQHEMDRLRPRAGLAGRRVLGVPFPAVNVYASADGYVLVAEVPGVSAEDLEVTSEGHHVTIRGEREIDYAEDVGIHRRERREGRFRRTFELPEDADVDKVQAAYRNGILMLRVPKAESAQPRTIAVQRD